MQDGIQHSMVQLGDGSRIALRQAGQGQPLLCLHGWAVTGDAFAPQLTGLCDRFRVIAPDFRAHGGSQPDRAASLDRLTDDILALAERLALENALLIGWSMGALVGWQALGRGLADRVTAMISIDMSPRVVSDADWRLGLKPGLSAADCDRIADRIAADWTGYLDRIVPRVFAAETERRRPDLLAALRAAAAGHDAAAMAALWRSMAQADCRAAIAGLPVPLHAAYGAMSQLYAPAVAEYLAAAAPNGQPHAFAASGHAPHLEQADAFNRLVRRIADAAHQTQSEDPHYNKPKLEVSHVR